MPLLLPRSCANGLPISEGVICAAIEIHSPQRAQRSGEDFFQCDGAEIVAYGFTCIFAIMPPSS